MSSDSFFFLILSSIQQKLTATARKVFREQNKCGVWGTCLAEKQKQLGPTKRIDQEL